MAEQDDDTGTEDIDPADMEDLDDGPGDDDADDAEGKEYTPPTKEEYEKLQRKIKRQESRISGLVGKGPKGKPVRDVDRALAAQLKGGKDNDDSDTSEADSKWRGIAIQNAAATQIAAAGFTGSAKAAERLAKLIDTSGIEPDRHGRFDLEDEIDELKEEYPELFAGKGGRTPAPRVRRSDVRDTSAPKMSESDRYSNQLLKEAGYK